MKVLFAVSNENMSQAIIKKYQAEYKQILSYKNVYYFNAILKELQRNKIHTCIETCGYCDSTTFKEVIQHCDMVIMDIKIMNEQEHIQYTKQSNKIILENANYLMKHHSNYLFRTPLIPTISDTKENLNQIKEFIQDSKWEQIPYNSLAPLKYEQLNIEFKLKGW